MKAMILAAGFGTRLFPLTVDRTKPAIPFLNKPLVGYVADYVARFGFSEVVVNLHHQPQSVMDALGDGTQFGVRIHYTLEEPEILGTSGALDNARHLLEDDTFLIVNGKIITDIDLSKAVEAHKKSGAIATMILMENKKHERFSIVEAENGLVSGFSGFPEPLTNEQIQNPKSIIRHPLMFTGIHILEPRVFDYIPRGVYSDIVPTFYNPAIKNGEKVVAHIAEGNWFELSTIPRYLDISLAMMKDANVCVGQNCHVSPAAKIANTVLWDDITVAEGAILNRTIIGDGVKIISGESFENAAVVRFDMIENVEIPEKSLKGYREGDKFVVPLGQ
jgi:NDP-sugar pyrophosphorylase family protein